MRELIYQSRSAPNLLVVGLVLSSTLFAATLCAAAPQEPAATANTASPAAISARETLEQAPEDVLFRGGPNGTVEVVREGQVIAAYPPGSLIITQPSRRALERAKQEREAKAAEKQAEAEKEETQDPNAQEAAAPQKDRQQASERATEVGEEEAEERATMEERAVTVLDGMTGAHKKVVPLEAILDTSSDPDDPERRALEERAVTILNGNTGNYFQALPLDELTGEQTNN